MERKAFLRKWHWIGIPRTISISQQNRSDNYSKKKKMLTLSHSNYWIFSLYPVFDIENHISINIFMHRHLMWINSHDWDVSAKKYECLLVLSQSTVVTNMSPQTFYLCPFQYWKMYSWLLSIARVRGADHLLEECLCKTRYVFWMIPHILDDSPYLNGESLNVKNNIWSKWISLWG